ncbi:SH3 domain-containing protein [Paraclostridium sp. AKS73]|uniref:SH3 domain-containing protein n=1 Tax=Paraclostridium sp. AKS73 TaxID=2876116 RepID=UPI0021E07BAC|nr:SH3 domain-containing protein [Paraclostridium sp. AKS73]MCU9813639.1 SH3 domain-containing protein [Paraclostridium sp. AKS73]
MKVSALNLRKEPSLEADILTTMQSGDRVVILGRVKTDLTYYQIEYVKNGKIYNGYASMFVSGVNTTEIFEDNLNNEFLGVLSERYESNGDPGLVSSGNGDYGGKSYGAWQFSSTMGSLDEFVSWLRNENNEFYKKLTDARALDDNTNCGPNFDKAWKEIAQNHNNTFYNLQHKYVKENFYDKLVNKLLKSGDFSNVVSTFAGRNVLWSTAVQHGVTGSYRIISPLQSKCNNVEDFIKAVYAERGRKDENGQLVYFANNSQAVQDSVAKRFIREQEDAIQCYRYSLENK